MNRKNCHATAQSKDPGNNLFWRYNRRRIEAEAVRDAMLNVAGNFNPKAEGPAVLVPVQPVLIEPALQTQTVGRDCRPQRASSTHHLSHCQAQPCAFLLWKPLMLPICRIPVRGASRAPMHLQSLELLNGNFSNDQARVFAGRLLKEKGWNPDALVQACLQACYRPRTHDAGNADRQLASCPSSPPYCEQRLDHKEDVPVPAWMPETLDKASAAALCDFSLAMFSLPGFLYLN